MEVPPISIPNARVYFSDGDKIDGTVFLDSVVLAFLEDGQDIIGGPPNSRRGLVRIPWACIDGFSMKLHRVRITASRFDISHSKFPDTAGRTRMSMSSKENTLGLLAIIVAYMKATAKLRTQEWRKLIEKGVSDPKPNIAFVEPHNPSRILLCDQPESVMPKEICMAIARQELQRELEAWPVLLAQCEEHVYRNMMEDLILHGNLRGTLVPLVLYKADGNEGTRSNLMDMRTS